MKETQDIARAEHGGADRHGGLNLVLLRLFALTADAFLGSLHPLGQTRDLWRVPGPQRVHGGVARLVGGLVEADPEVALAFSGG